MLPCYLGDYVSGLNEKKQITNDFRQNQNTNYKLHKKWKLLNHLIEGLEILSPTTKNCSSCNLMIWIFHFLIKWNILFWFDTMMTAMWACFPTYIHIYEWVSHKYSQFHIHRGWVDIDEYKGRNSYAKGNKTSSQLQRMQRLKEWFCSSLASDLFDIFFIAYFIYRKKYRLRSFYFLPWKQYLLKMKAKHAIKHINLWRLQGTKYFTIPAVAHWWYR